MSNIVEIKKSRLVLSKLSHTWLIDVDGTIVKHNGYLVDGVDTLLRESKVFLDRIPEGDFIVFLTSREKKHRKSMEQFLKREGVRYDTIVFGCPLGERIVINDRKPGGLNTAVSVNLERDRGIELDVIEDDNI